MASFDAFLSHDWGTDEEGRRTHDRVKLVGRLLESHGLRVWLDESEMQGNIVQRMMEGIDNSGIVVVFVTRNYITKAAGQGPDGEADNCFREFQYSTERKDVTTELLPVVMERSCCNQRTWEGAVGFNFGSHLYIDLSDDATLEAKVASEIAPRILASRPSVASAAAHPIEQPSKRQRTLHPSAPAQQQHGPPPPMPQQPSQPPQRIPQSDEIDERHRELTNEEDFGQVDAASVVNIISTPWHVTNPMAGRKAAATKAFHDNPQAGIYTFNPNTGLRAAAAAAGMSEAEQGRRWLQLWTQVLKKVKKTRGTCFVMAKGTDEDNFELEGGAQHGEVNVAKLAKVPIEYVFYSLSPAATSDLSQASAASTVATSTFPVPVILTSANPLPPLTSGTTRTAVKPDHLKLVMHICIDGCVEDLDVTRLKRALIGNLASEMKQSEIRITPLKRSEAPATSRTTSVLSWCGLIRTPKCKVMCTIDEEQYARYTSGDSDSSESSASSSDDAFIKKALEAVIKLHLTSNYEIDVAWGPLNGSVLIGVQLPALHANLLWQLVDQGDAEVRRTGLRCCILEGRVARADGREHIEQRVRSLTFQAERYSANVLEEVKPAVMDAMAETDPKFNGGEVALDEPLDAMTKSQSSYVRSTSTRHGKANAAVTLRLGDDVPDIDVQEYRTLAAIDLSSRSRKVGPDDVAVFRSLGETGIGIDVDEDALHGFGTDVDTEVPTDMSEIATDTDPDTDREDDLLTRKVVAHVKRRMPEFKGEVEGRVLGTHHPIPNPGSNEGEQSLGAPTEQRPHPAASAITVTVDGNLAHFDVNAFKESLAGALTSAPIHVQLKPVMRETKHSMSVLNVPWHHYGPSGSAPATTRRAFNVSVDEEGYLHHVHATTGHDAGADEFEGMESEIRAAVENSFPEEVVTKDDIKITWVTAAVESKAAAESTVASPQVATTSKSSRHTPPDVMKGGDDELAILVVSGASGPKGGRANGTYALSDQTAHNRGKWFKKGDPKVCIKYETEKGGRWFIDVAGDSSLYKRDDCHAQLPPVDNIPWSLYEIRKGTLPTVSKQATNSELGVSITGADRALFDFTRDEKELALIRDRGLESFLLSDVVHVRTRGAVTYPVRLSLRHRLSAKATDRQLANIVLMRAKQHGEWEVLPTATAGSQYVEWDADGFSIVWAMNKLGLLSSTPSHLLAFAYRRTVKFCLMASKAEADQVSFPSYQLVARMELNVLHHTKVKIGSPSPLEVSDTSFVAGAAVEFAPWNGRNKQELDAAGVYPTNLDVQVDVLTPLMDKETWKWSIPFSSIPPPPAPPLPGVFLQTASNPAPDPAASGAIVEHSTSGDGSSVADALRGVGTAAAAAADAYEREQQRERRRLDNVAQASNAIVNFLALSSGQLQAVIAGQQQLNLSVRDEIHALQEAVRPLTIDLDLYNEAVVALGVGFKDSSDRLYPPNVQSGSGFFVDVKGVLMTDHHVLLDIQAVPEPPGWERVYCVGIGEQPIVWCYTAELLQDTDGTALISVTPRRPPPGGVDYQAGVEKPWLDLAVLRLDQLRDPVSGILTPITMPIQHPPHSRKPPEAPQARGIAILNLRAGNPTPWSTGEPCWILGYGQQQPVAKSRHTNPGAIVSYRNFDPSIPEMAGSPWIITTADMLAGHSGGPVIDRHGEVIGWTVLSLGDRVGVSGTTHVTGTANVSGTADVEGLARVPTAVPVDANQDLPLAGQSSSIAGSVRATGSVTASGPVVAEGAVRAGGKELCGGLHALRPINEARTLLTAAGVIW